jgi:hypothetical protein
LKMLLVDDSMLINRSGRLDREICHLQMLY